MTLASDPLAEWPVAPGAAGPVRPSAAFMWRHPAHWIGLGLGSGLSPRAPGTVGTLWAWAAYLVFSLWLDPVAWAWERPDSGRSFGFTGMHFHENWNKLEYRRLIVQGVLWSLHESIPENGLELNITESDLALPQKKGD
jgi:hypothetical protein